MPNRAFWSRSRLSSRRRSHHICAINQISEGGIGRLGKALNRFHTAVVASLLLGTAIGGLLLAAPPVSAHATRIVGEYELTVGWREEPAIVGILNGLDLGIEDHLSNGTTIWVVGVESNLTATLSTGPASMMKALAPQDGRPGWYTFDVIPTAAGGYSVKLVGMLKTTAVNVTVPLDTVAQASDYQFPVTDPSSTDLQNSIAALNAQLATPQTLLTVLVADAVLPVLIAGVGPAFTTPPAPARRRGAPNARVLHYAP